MSATIDLHDRDAVAAERDRRLAKLEALRDQGVEPYPPVYARDHTVGALRERFAGLAPDASTGAPAHVAGRLMLIRRHGGAVFATLEDQTGSIQLLASRDALGASAFEAIEALDRGDWVGAAGTVMTTHTGELTVEVSEVRLLAKALRALPDKHRGLTDPEVRLRERYLDLIANHETRRVFDTRSAVIAAIRETLVERGFTEVETPVLETDAGGAAARPFVTHHNALNRDMYLRIALELHLKRLVVGGFERVFELGRVFRNEGLDTRHNPEFTLLEAYQALADYRDMMELVETLVSRAAIAANGTTLIELEGRTVDLAPPWRRVTMADLVAERTGERMHPAMPIAHARAICDRLGIAYEDGWGAGRLMAEVYDETAEHGLIEPTFVLDHPRETSPLARPHRDDPDLVERFEVVVGGRELANAYSELNDPVDQRQRFEAEAAAKAAGDEEAGDVDEDYLRALEYGLPPTGGLGIGIDRLVMLIAGVPAIRDAILFPAMRPEAGDAGTQAPVVAPAPALPAPPPAAAVAPVLVRAPGQRAPRVLGLLTALVGLLLLCADVIGAGRLIDAVDGGVAGHVATAVAGFGLLLVAGQLRRGKRRAWQVAAVLTAAAGGAAWLRGPDPLVVLAATAMLVALVWHRAAFTGRPDPGSLLDVARFLPRFLVLALAFGLVAHHVDGGRSFTATLLALGLSGVLGVSLLAFRAVRADGPPEDRERARALVRAHGDDTLDYFALRPDKRAFFSAAGDAMLAYAVLDGHALVSADPIGPPDARGRVVEEFLAHCRERGLRVAFLAARERDLPLYRRLGLHGMYLGDEAVVRCDTFSLAGSSMKGVRSAVARVGRACEFRLLPETEAAPELLTALNALRARWRDGEAERGFTMELGGDVRGDDPDLLLAVATGPDGHPLGFLRLAPCFGADPGWSLDLMQHDPDAPNGMTEYLIAMTAQELGARGYRRLSLNFAAWGRLFAPDARLSPVQRLQRRLGLAFSSSFQIASLRDFNAKFDPEWVPRSIVVESRDDLPRVALLYATVEGFLRIPLIGARR